MGTKGKAEEKEIDEGALATPPAITRMSDCVGAGKEEKGREMEGGRGRGTTMTTSGLNRFLLSAGLPDSQKLR